jgi:hypothetical protein
MYVQFTILVKAKTANRTEWRVGVRLTSLYSLILVSVAPFLLLSDKTTLQT